MDPSDPLRHLEFFSVPNNQTINPVDRSFSLGGPTATQPPSLWDTPAGLGVPGFSGPPSSTPTSLSLDSIAPSTASTGLTSMTNLAGASQPINFGGPPRPTLPMRAPRSRDGHERKRSRLSTDATPFDSVDYWIQFDNDEALADIPEGVEVDKAGLKGKARAAPPPPQVQRRASATHASTSTATTPSTSRPPAPKAEDFIDDSALDKALSDEDDEFSSMNLADHLSRIDTAPPADVPPREGLYSTPLSWERPQPGIRMDSLIGLNQQALNDAEQRRLIAIAMNPGPSMGGLGSNVNVNFGAFDNGFNGVFGQGLGGLGLGRGLDPVSPPKPSTAQTRPPPPPPPKKQGSISDKGKEKLKLGDRTAHNDIERKYRTNLKDKIAELRDAVPALQTISETGEEDASQPGSRAKVSKGTVLTKATEYIHQLERRNKQIMQEHRKLRERLNAFEQLLNATARPTYQMPTYSRTLFDPRGFC
ncbi:hypothetical protein OQA88_10136 [Cercophora sp. LCS_1]